MGNYWKALLLGIYLLCAGCGGGDNVQMPEDPAPMPEHGPTSEGLEEQFVLPT